MKFLLFRPNGPMLSQGTCHRTRDMFSECHRRISGVFTCNHPACTNRHIWRLLRTLTMALMSGQHAGCRYLWSWPSVRRFDLIRRRCCCQLRGTVLWLLLIWIVFLADLCLAFNAFCCFRCIQLTTHHRGRVFELFIIIIWHQYWSWGYSAMFKVVIFLSLGRRCGPEISGTFTLLIGC